MAQDDVKSHLDKGLYGTPLVNPEEQHKYLGTFRERCYLSMTVAEMIQPKNKENFLKELKKHPDASILLNGALPLSVQNQYIQLATKNNSRFTVVNDYVTANPEEFGLLLTDVYKRQPLVNPEEQHKYLGTFRERCYLSMTVAEMIQPKNKENFLKELKKHPDASILLNGALPLSVQNQYIQLATKNNSRFTVVNDYVTANPEEFGLLLTAKEAVNEPVIDIEKKYPEENSSPVEKEKPKKKKSFWDRLF
ncbi:hypothetical protein A5853_000621 [Enterococcus faecium]|nr:hypothetical protein A5853_000621 [Enterococcus faecium]